jgi:hypothetical protein
VIVNRSFGALWSNPYRNQALPEFPYRVVERAAAAVYGASDDSSRCRCRGRIKVFHRENVLGLGKDVKVGHGFRVRYNMEHIERWLCCMELMELGLAATVAARLVISQWPRSLAAIFRLAQATVKRQPGEGDVVLLLSNVHVMSGEWTPGPGYPGVPEIAHCTLGELPGRIAKAAKPPRAARMLTTNLSSLLRRFHEQLAAEAAEEPGRSAARRKAGANKTWKTRWKRYGRKRT